NHRVRAQWQVGHYRIDLVVEGGGKRLAVECDGDRWDPPEKLAEDLERQAVLERLGWTFVRVRGSEFFWHPDQALQPGFEMLQRLEIPPEGSRPLADEPKSETNELLDILVRRADALRLEWLDGPSGARGDEVSIGEGVSSARIPPGESSADEERILDALRR